MLFHYTKTESALSIAKSNKFILSKINKLNDPLENRQIKFHSSKFLSENNHYISSQLNQTRNNIINIASFSTGNYKHIYPVEYPMNLLSKRQGYFMPRMWAQYADNHNGVCFVLNKNQILKSINKELSNHFHVFHNKICYTNFLNTLSHIELTDILDVDLDKLKLVKNRKYVIAIYNNNIHDLIFTKDKDWRDEKEYRIVAINKAENIKTDNISFNIEPALVAIVLGLNNSVNPVLFRDFLGYIPILLLKHIDNDVMIINY